MKDSFVWRFSLVFMLSIKLGIWLYTVEMSEERHACLSRRRPRIRVPSSPPFFDPNTSIFCQNVPGQHYFRIADNLGTTSPCDLGAECLNGTFNLGEPH